MLLKDKTGKFYFVFYTFKTCASVNDHAVTTEIQRQFWMPTKRASPFEHKTLKFFLNAKPLKSINVSRIST